MMSLLLHMCSGAAGSEWPHPLYQQLGHWRLPAASGISRG